MEGLARTKLCAENCINTVNGKFNTEAVFEEYSNWGYPILFYWATYYKADVIKLCKYMKQMPVKLINVDTRWRMPVNLAHWKICRSSVQQLKINGEIKPIMLKKSLVRTLLDCLICVSWFLVNRRVFQWRRSNSSY